MKRPRKVWERDGSALYHGDCLAWLRRQPSNSVNCCVTSPPYWGLRDYGVEPGIWGGDPNCDHVWGAWLTPAANGIVNERGMTARTLSKRSATRKPRWSNFCERCGAWMGCLGLEPSPELYVRNLVEIFREVQRVLRDDGTLWLNIGDSYASGKGSCFNPGGGATSYKDYRKKAGIIPLHRLNLSEVRASGLKPKDLCGIPWRLALALQADAWYLRSDIIWNKLNPMPESVRDRPTKTHEYIFLLTKSHRYHYDRLAIREPCQSGPSDIKKMRECRDRITSRYRDDKSSGHSLLAGGNGKIGRKRGVGDPAGRNCRSVWTFGTNTCRDGHFATFPKRLVESCILAGCPTSGIVMDCFAGASTTGTVCLETGRRFLGCELNADYCRIGAKRLREAAQRSRRIAA